MQVSGIVYLQELKRHVYGIGVFRVCVGAHAVWYVMKSSAAQEELMLVIFFYKKVVVCSVYWPCDM